MQLSPAQLGINAVTVTTSGTATDVSNLENMSLQFTAASISSGNGVFTVKVSVDGVNYVGYNMLIDNVTNSNAQNNTRVASKTLSSNTSVIVGLDTLSIGFKSIQVICTVTTDGSYSATLFGNKKTGA